METSEFSSKGFPRSLLEQPVQERLQYFEKLVVSHKRLRETYDELLHAIRYPATASLIYVFGPTGVGKTTLLQQIEKALIKDALADPNASPGHIPVSMLEAISPDSGNFNWKDYYTRALEALNEPMIEDKVTYKTRGIHRDEKGQLIIERSVTVADLRRVLEKCLQHRKPRAFIVDEAQHFQKMSSGRRLIDQMDSLKSLANLTKTVHLLTGTYDLLGITKLSAQLSRRSKKIHFPRYRVDNSADFIEFEKLLRTFQKYLPLHEEPDLVSYIDYFYDQCLGCIGMLKAWLYRTLAAALEQNQRTINEDLWKKHTELPGILVDMSEEICRGEDDFWERQDEKQLESLRRRLRTPRGPNIKPEIPQTQGTPPPHQNDSPPETKNPPPNGPKPKGRRRRVGEPNPVRRPVGQEGPNAN